MELNLIGALTMFKTMDMVSNFSEFARTFGRDGHTIKKMYEGKGRKRLPSLSLFLSIFSPSLQYFLRVWGQARFFSIAPRNWASSRIPYTWLIRPDPYLFGVFSSVCLRYREAYF